MIKTFLKFILSVCIFFISGYNHVSAHGSPSALYTNIAEHSNKSSFLKQNSTGNEGRNTKCFLSAFEKEEDNDDDDSVSSRKHLGCFNYPTSILFTLISPFLYNWDSNIFSLHQLLSHSTYGRYLLLQVFRI